MSCYFLSDFLTEPEVEPRVCVVSVSIVCCSLWVCWLLVVLSKEKDPNMPFSFSKQSTTAVEKEKPTAYKLAKANRLRWLLLYER